MSNRVFAAGIWFVVAAASLAGCRGGESEAAPAPAATPAAAASAPAGATVAESTPAGKFKLTIPDGYTQGIFNTVYPVVRLITTAGVTGPNEHDDIVVQSLRGTDSTPEKSFSFNVDALKKAFPTCKFPGADHVAEVIAPGYSANYVTYKCEAMPFTFVNFTTRGPGGLQLAGYQQSTSGNVDSWKAAVGSTVTG